MSMNSTERQATRDPQNKGPCVISWPSIHLRFTHISGALRVVSKAAACTLIGSVAAPAQPEVIRCQPPDAPMIALPVEVLAEYRTEIAAEFEAYFASVSVHIACLDEERARAMEEARSATEAYTRLLSSPPVRKDLP